MARILFLITAMIFATALQSTSSQTVPSSLPEPVQPQSVIDSIGDPYAPFRSNANIMLATKTKPVPRNPDDLPAGTPSYHWDFGPLHALANDDGTAAIYTDVAGTYDVTVFCEQDFIDANGVIYSERTETSAKDK